MRRKIYEKAMKKMGGTTEDKDRKFQLKNQKKTYFLADKIGL